MSTRSLNKVFLIGNLTRDAELRYTSGGTPVTTFTVATNRNYTDSTGKAVETAEFTNVVAWAKLAEICAQLLKKGSKVHLEGRLQTTSWDDKETGKTMRRTEVVATDMILLSSGGYGAGGSHSDHAEHSESHSDSSSSDMGENVDVKDIDIDLGTDFQAVVENDEKSDKKDKKDDSDEKSDEDTGSTPF